MKTKIMMKNLIMIILCIVLTFGVCACADAFNPEEICLNAVLKEFNENDEIWGTKVVKLKNIPHKHDFNDCFEITVYSKDSVWVYIGGIEYHGSTIISVDMDFAYSIVYETSINVGD